MLIKTGEKLHIITRKLLETEIRRHFVGEVEYAEGANVRICGYLILVDASNRFVRKPEERTKIIDLGESGYIVNVLPTEVDLKKIEYKLLDNHKLVMTDGEGFTMDINEFGSNR